MRRESRGDPALRAPAPGAELAAEPLGPHGRLNEWGRKAGAGPSPSTRAPAPPPPPGWIRFPHPSRPPRLSTGCCARLSKLSLGGVGTRATSTETAESQAHDLSWPPFSLPGGCPGDRDRHGLGPSPSRPSVARCGRMWRMWRPGHSSGRAPRGTDEIPLLPRAQCSCCGTFYLRQSS